MFIIFLHERLLVTMYVLTIIFFGRHIDLTTFNISASVKHRQIVRLGAINQ